MRDEFDRFFDRLTHDFTAIARTNAEGWRWGLDVVDGEDKVTVRAEAPGFDAEDFDIRVEDGQLVLRAAKKTEKKDDKGNVEEYQEQQCYESVSLPAGVDKDKIDAKYHNGVLTLSMPKTEASKAKRIAVKAT
jgi:HSP20 family protein